MAGRSPSWPGSRGATGRGPAEPGHPPSASAEPEPARPAPSRPRRRSGALKRPPRDPSRAPRCFTPQALLGGVTNSNFNQLITTGMRIRFFPLEILFERAAGGSARRGCGEPGRGAPSAARPPLSAPFPSRREERGRRDRGGRAVRGKLSSDTLPPGRIGEPPPKSRGSPQPWGRILPTTPRPAQRRRGTKWRRDSNAARCVPAGGRRGGGVPAGFTAPAPGVARWRTVRN